jgi:hypothetical protein
MVAVLPTTVSENVTLHVAVPVETGLNVQDVGENDVDPSEEVNVSTKPVGVLADVGSATVAVQVVDPPVVNDIGEHDTDVVVVFVPAACAKLGMASDAMIANSRSTWLFFMRRAECLMPVVVFSSDSPKPADL